MKTEKIIHIGRNDELSVRVQEVISGKFGLFVWPSGIVLAEFLWRKCRRDVEGKNVLELGAGIAVPGIVAGAMGAKKVFLTDHSPEREQNILENCSQCIRLNGLEKNVAAHALDWGEFTTSTIDLCQNIDLVIGADCFYSSEDFESVFATLSLIFECNPEAFFYTTYHVRSSNRSIAYLLEKWGMRAENIAINFLDGGEEGESIQQFDSISLLKISPARD